MFGLLDELGFELAKCLGGQRSVKYATEFLVFRRIGLQDDPLGDLALSPLSAVRTRLWLDLTFVALDERGSDPPACGIGRPRGPVPESPTYRSPRFTGFDLGDQIGMRDVCPIERRHQDAVNIEGEVEADEIRLLKWSHGREASPEALLHDLVERLGTAMARGNEGYRLPLQSMLETISDEPRNVGSDVDSFHPGTSEQTESLVDDFGCGESRLDDFHQRH